MDKRSWRATATAERAGIDIDSKAYCSVLAEFLSENVAEDRVVVGFDAMPGEVDLRALIEGHRRPSQRFALTRTPVEGHRLSVHPYGCAMERHRYGYMQPTEDAAVVPDGRIGAVLVPGAAFDRSGVRLGRGKGYYDRLLSRLPPGVLFIGITGGYVVNRLPSERHDVAMTHLATEAGVFEVPLAKAALSG